MPKTSLVITTCNRPDLLPRAVESARAAGGDIEIVVVDDASTDGTAAVCKSLAAINYVRLEKNQGVAGARNVGLLASQGEYVAFLDDDDQRLPGSLELQIDALEREPQAGLIYGQAMLGAQDGKPTGRAYPSQGPQGDIFWDLLSRNFIPCGSVVFRRACLERVGLLEERIPGLDDWDLWVRISEVYPVVATMTPVSIWRRSTPVSGQGTSDSARLVSACVRQFRDVWMKLQRAAAAPRKTRRTAWQKFSENMAEHLIWESARSLRHGRTGQPLRNLSILRQLDALALLRIAEHRALRIPRKTPAAFPVFFD